MLLGYPPGMDRFVHLCRYGVRKKRDEVEAVEIRGDGLAAARGKLWDLRTGAAAGRAPGFFAALDGRLCEYDDGGRLVVVHPDGRRVVLQFPAPPTALAAGYVHWLRRWLVARDSHVAAWITMDTETGAPVGRLTGQGAEGSKYAPVVFDPYDGASLFLCEAGAVREVRAGETALRTATKAAPGVALVACARTQSGDWALLERPADAAAAFDVTRDAIIIRTAGGEERARLADLRPPFQVRRLGEHLLVTHAEGFAVLDDDLREIARTPFFDDDTFARTLPLPSGREWLAIGGYGEWDHYGEPALAPSASAAPPPEAKPSSAKKKATAKKSASPKTKR